MCGRYDQHHGMEDYLAQMDWLWDLPLIDNSEAPLRYNVPPRTYRPVLHLDDQQPLIDDLHWGYQAPWAVGKVPVAINSRVDKLLGRYWKPLLKSGRAIVIADAWYEWTEVDGVKQPWRIHRKDNLPILMAAVANFGPMVDDNKATAGFAIVTDAAEGGMVDVHDRRPAIFDPADAMQWLDHSLTPEEAEDLARTQALGPNSFHWYKVGKAVGSVKNEGEDLILELNEP